MQRKSWHWHAPGVRGFPSWPILSLRRKTLRTRLLRRLRTALCRLACGGTVVTLCRSLGIEAKTLGHWCLVGWVVMAGGILVVGLVVFAAPRAPINTLHVAGVVAAMRIS